MHDVASVCQIILGEGRACVPCSLNLDAALGARLAEPIRMDMDSPPFDRALVDGYALVAGATQVGQPLRILGRQDAGSDLRFQVSPGTCVAINTGAPLPLGADAVAMVEDTRMLDLEASTAPAGGRVLTQSGGVVAIQKPVASGAGIQRRGGDARAGQEVLPSGTILNAASLAVAAAAGAVPAQVIPLPRVAVLVTGDELVDPATIPTAAQIRNTNSALLAASIHSAGATLVRSSTAGDEIEILRAEIQAALAQADVLIISGGMSMGTRDLVPGLLVDMGFTLHVQKVAIKPGKPFVFGTCDSKTAPSARQYVLGLPGNPVSAFVCFQRFGKLLLHRLAGGSVDTPLRQMPLAAPITANGDREFYLPAIVGADSTGRENVTPLAWRGSADIFTLARANALLIVPANSPALAAGTSLNVLHPL